MKVDPFMFSLAQAPGISELIQEAIAALGDETTGVQVCLGMLLGAIITQTSVTDEQILTWVQHGLANGRPGIQAVRDQLKGTVLS